MTEQYLGAEEMELSGRTLASLIALGVGLLTPIGLFIFRWVDWDFQPSWIAASQFFSNIYIPLFTIVPVLGLAYQIWKKSSSDKVTFLIEGFRRQSAELLSLLPGDPKQTYIAMWQGLLNGQKPPHAAVLFLNQHSRFVHAILSVGYSLTALKDIDRTAAEMLRMELFTLVERDHFSKYEFIAVACVLPSNYRWVCTELEEEFRDALRSQPPAS
ncbi:hypothetical protein [Stutzerimonas nitrititolerans]|uniref:hypothetical protein n=1 Tax=Stutzerimonas nitrititolerans TaxID=2482751 RepID=UPI0028A29A85|nr:hypothetical protein [Stutzerimonas nitrititolerans]